MVDVLGDLKRVLRVGFRRKELSTEEEEEEEAG